MCLNVVGIFLVAIGGVLELIVRPSLKILGSVISILVRMIFMYFVWMYHKELKQLLPQRSSQDVKSGGITIVSRV